MNILLTSHGSLCEGLLDAFHMMAAGADHVSTVSLTDTGIDDFRDRLTARVNELLAQGDLLILADLLGGTPYNEAYALFLTNPEHIRLVAGANFSMLLEALTTLTRLLPPRSRPGLLASWLRRCLRTPRMMTRTTCSSRREGLAIRRRGAPPCRAARAAANSQGIYGA